MMLFICGCDSSPSCFNEDQLGVSLSWTEMSWEWDAQLCSGCCWKSTLEEREENKMEINHLFNLIVALR